MSLAETIAQIARHRLSDAAARRVPEQCSAADGGSCRSFKLSYHRSLRFCSAHYQSWLVWSWLQRFARTGNLPGEEPPRRLYPGMAVGYLLMTQRVRDRTFRWAYKEFTAGTLPSKAEGTTLALVEYVPDDEHFEEFHVMILVWDNDGGAMTVIPLSPFLMKEHLVEIPWARAVPGTGGPMRIGFQLAHSPYLTMLWLDTACDYQANHPETKISMAQLAAEDQTGFRGDAEYEFELVDTLLPRTPAETAERMLGHGKVREALAKDMVFMDIVPGGTSGTFVVDTRTTSASSSLEGEGGVREERG